MIKDRRIPEYQYLKQLQEYIASAMPRYIDGRSESFIYPRQLEIHLPANRQSPCNLKCDHCFGTLYEKDLGRWEIEGLKLLHNLRGAIPYNIFGGAYTEPLMSPFLFAYLAATKHYNNHFGIHTNGVLLESLDNVHSFFKNLHEISSDKVDYISISLDAGSGSSWSKVKNGNAKDFYSVLSSIEKMCGIRARSCKDSHAIRIVYLASDETAKREEFEFISSFAKAVGVDSVRFSIPYDFYNKSFDEVKKYKENVEDRLEPIIKKATSHLVSKNLDETPYVFWNPPFFTDIERFNFEKCYYGLFQITLASDGYIYPCSAIAAPNAKHLRRGLITSNVKDFDRQCWGLQHDPVRCKPDCFDHGLRGNRQALEINTCFNKEKL